MYHSSRILLRTIRVTLAQEVELSKTRAQARYDMQNGNLTAREKYSTVPSLAESLQILDVEDIKDEKCIQQRYDKLFEANDRTKGGTLYLQSKIVRAKERINIELSKMAAEQTKNTDISEQTEAAVPNMNSDKKK